MDRMPCLAVSLASTLAISGCATLETLGVQPLRFAQADDRPSDLRLLTPLEQPPLGGVAIRLWAEVENPNDFGLTLSEVRGDLFLENAEAIAVDLPLGLALTARQDTVIPLDVSLEIGNLPRLDQVVRAALEGDRLDYRLDGTFAVEAGRFGHPRFGPLTLMQGEVRVR